MFDRHADSASKTAALMSAPARSRAVHVLVIAVVLALLAVAAVVTAGQAVLAAVTSTQSTLTSTRGPDSGCAVPEIPGTTVTAAGLSPSQVQVAHTIWRVAHEVGVGDRGAVVGIATAYQESTLGANKATARPNRDVDVGTMQQRALPGWYAGGKTVAENVTILNDPAYAARVFFTGYRVTAEDHAAARAAGTSPAGPVGYVTPGLQQINGWETMSVTRAAQAVQRSAFPDAYARHEPMARQLVARFTAETPQLVTAGLQAGPLCDPAGAVDAANCPATGLRVETGLTPDALRTLRCAVAQWPDLTYGGVRADALPDHPSGRAIDIMTPGNCAPIGDTIAEWAKQNAASLGVDYVIWCQRIWSVARDREGWRPMRDRGSVTQNHGDHVHITVNGNSAGTAPSSVSGEGGNQTVVDPLENYSPSAWFGKAGSMWSSGYHTGLDFSAPAGTPVRAAKAGTCLGSTWHSAYGNLLKIDHGDVQTWYAHLQAPSSCSGPVKAGTVVGRVGSTGNSSGPHLHLEVRRGGVTEDPDAWLARQGVKVKGSRV